MGAGSRDRDDQPNHRGKRETAQGCNFKQQGMARPKVADHGEREKKNGCRGGGKHDQGHINDAVKFLPVAAMLALLEVLLVVATHFRRQAGNIVPPAGQNLSDEWIYAQLTHKELQSERLKNCRLRSQHHAVEQQRPALA